MKIERHGPPPGEAPTLVMLGEWGDFPSRVAGATGWGVVAWAPPGQDLEGLSGVLDAVGFRHGVLYGQGASVAAVYAGSVSDHRVRGLILEAPRFGGFEEAIDYFRVPVLALGGDPAEVDLLVERCYSPVDVVALGPDPHRERPEDTLAALADFTEHLRRFEEATNA